MDDTIQHARPGEDALTRRQRAIVRLVQEQGFATIEALARQFAVSSQTIRREIIRLHEAKLLQRFHGGAGLREGKVRLGYAHKQTVAAGSKDRIGRRVAEILPDGAAVFLDVGTTVEAVARSLRGRSGLRVFTCSLPAAALLAGEEAIETFVTGGSVRGPDGSLVGDTALAGISLFKVDYAVLGCSGFDSDGTVMDFDLQKVAIKRAMLRNCRQAILAADGSKFEKAAIARIAPLSEFSTLVTDVAPPAHLRGPMEACGLTVIVA